MDIELYKHNQEAYEKTVEMFKKHNRCAIIHPTGTGKSYIALKWLLKNNDKKQLIITSLKAIKKQFEETIKENGLTLENDFPNLKIKTYSSLLKDNDIKADMIVLDEFHRTGAPKWGEKIYELLELNKNSKVLGLTATPVRYLDGKKDMSDEVFEGNVSSHITLPKAIAEGILPPPIYINAIYSFKEDLDIIEEKIKNISNNEEKKNLEKEIKEAKRMIEQCENIPDLLKKYIPKSNGKYLVFCRDIEHLNNMKNEANSWFSEINKEIEVHYIHSQEKEEENEYAFTRFKYIKNESLKLLYSIGMLNEGVHINDIDGVIMLRQTSSPILYQQQLGRGLSTGKNNHPLIFDIVNNIECLKDIELLRNSVIKIMEKSQKSREKIEQMKKQFKVIDDYRKISDLIKKLDINATYGWDKKYELLKKYVEEHNGQFPPVSEPIIGSWLSYQKLKLKDNKKYSPLTTEQIKLLDQLGDWKKAKIEKGEENWYKKYELLKKYVEENNGQFPIAKESTIGRWFDCQKQKIRGNKKDNPLTTEQIELLNQLGDWQTPRKELELEDWYKKYNLLKKYVEEHNGQFPLTKEPIIGRWFDKQKQKVRGKRKYKPLTTEQIELLNQLGDWQKSRKELDLEDWYKKYNLLKEYVEEHNGQFPLQKEPIIGCWLSTQREKIRYNNNKHKPLTTEQIELLNKLGDWQKSRKELESEDWYKKYNLLKKYVEENNGQFPLQKEPIIGRWLSTQKQKIRGIKKYKPLTTEQLEHLKKLGIFDDSVQKIEKIKKIKKK